MTPNLFVRRGFVLLTAGLIVAGGRILMKQLDTCIAEAEIVSPQLPETAP